MVFSSSVFLLWFLPIFLLVYHLVGKSLKNYVILLASIFFYSWGAPKFVFVILISTFIDFHIVKQLYQSTDKRHRKLFLATSIFINLGLLAYFKYANFFVENLNASLSLLGVKELGWTEVLLPIGISFYTFQTLTYSVDVYRKIHAPLDRVTDYLLYIMSFPQMIAGPIVRFHSIADEITNRKETYDDKLIGFYRFSIGLAKKVLIANVMAEQADAIFNSNLTDLNMSKAWIGMIAYTFQIYFDFSGYSDMAIGLGRIMGFHFPENFDSPYVSRSISEFWRRWHITLGNFMKNYLYIPLGGNRVGSQYRLFFNLGLVFLLSGLWHGASWNFVIWGAFHGAFLILDRLFLLSLLKRIGTIPATLVTFIIVMISWVIFRLEEASAIKIYLLKLFTFEGSFDVKIIPGFWAILLMAVFFAFFTMVKKGAVISEKFFGAAEHNFKSHIFWVSISVLLFIFSISSITSSGFNPFIYFRF